MKTKIILIATIALFALGGCKTVKQTETAKQTTTTYVTVNQSSEQSNDIKLTTDDIQLTTDKGNISEVVSEEITRTEFSVPDSAGKQHVTAVTTTTRGVVRNESKNLQENKKNTSQLSDNSDYKSGARVVASSENKVEQTTKTTSKHEPDGWVVFFMFVAGLVLALLALKPLWLTKSVKWVLKLLKK